MQQLIWQPQQQQRAAAENLLSRFFFVYWISSVHDFPPPIVHEVAHERKFASYAINIAF